MTQITHVETALTDRMVEHALGLTYEAIPLAVIDRTKQLFLDFLGVALGGRALGASSEALLRGVQELSAGVHGSCTVVGEREGQAPHFAALLNAAFAHSMDFDDTHREAIMHQGAPLFAALLAAAEVAESSGRGFLTAAVAGYDIGGRLGIAHGDGVHRRGFHPTATTGIFAVTAASGRLLDIDKETLTDALGLDLSLAAGCQQFLETGGWNKPFQVGLTAHNALYSLAFARAGLQGTRQPLEGRYGYYATFAEPGSDLTKATDGLGQRFEALYTALKPYPCCRFNHAAIDAVVNIVKREAVRPEEVERIDVFIPSTNYQLVAEPVEVKRRPRGIVDGQFSVYFAAAIAAVEHGYTWESYQRLDDSLVQRLMEQTSAHPSDGLLEMSAQVAIKTARGTWKEEVRQPKGEPENPLTWQEIRAKFASLASRSLDKQRGDRIVEIVQELEHQGNLSALTAALRP